MLVAQTKPALSVANHLYSLLSTYGGGSVTIDLKTPKAGYMVAVEHSGLTFDSITAFNPHAVAAEIERNPYVKIVGQNNSTPTLYFGVWKDGQTRKVYFDISVNIQLKECALHLAKLHHQIAIFDVVECKEIRVNY